MEELTLDVRFLGGFEVRCGKNSLAIAANTSAKVNQFLALLLFNAPEVVTKDTVREALYYDSDADADNSLKVLLFRLRRTLAAELDVPENEVVLLKGGKYSLNPAITVRSDVAQLMKQYGRVQESTVEEEQYALLHDIMRLYQGEMLPHMSSTQWVIYENARVTDAYTRTVNQLVEFYRVRGDHQSAYDTCRRALAHFPFESEWMVGCIDAQVAMKNQRKAQSDYEEFTGILYDELGVYPSEELLEALRNVNKLEAGTGAEDITHSMEEPQMEGAYYCNYPSFVDSYRILRRIIKRDNLKASLVLFNVTEKDGSLLQDKDKVVQAISILRMALTRSLRKSDMLTRFTRAQLLVMMWNMPNDKVEIAVSRIRKRIEQEDPDGICRMTYRVLDTEEPPAPDTAADTGRKHRKTWQQV